MPVFAELTNVPVLIVCVIRVTLAELTGDVDQLEAFAFGHEGDVATELNDFEVHLVLDPIIVNIDHVDTAAND